MVNSIGLLEDEDTLLSSPGVPRRENLYERENSSEDSAPEGDREDSEGYDDAEEVGPTHREGSYNPFDIALTDQP